MGSEGSDFHTLYFCDEGKLNLLEFDRSQFGSTTLQVMFINQCILLNASIYLLVCTVNYGALYQFTTPDISGGFFVIFPDERNQCA